MNTTATAADLQRLTIHTEPATPTIETALAKTGDLSTDGIVSLRNAYAPIYEALAPLVEQARAVQPDQPKVARAVRLALRGVRCDGENARKKLKADILLRGKAIDGMQHVLEYASEPLEKALLEIEEAEERKEAARKAALQKARADELRPFADPTYMDLAAMGDEAWAMVLSGAKLAHEKKLADAARELAEREAREKEAAEQLAKKLEADRLERERIQAENERLQAEAKAAADKLTKERAEQRVKDDAAAAERLAKEQEAARERQKLAATAEAEKRKRELAEAEAKRLRDEVEAKVKAEAAAKRKAARAPDKEKVAALVAKVKAIEVPKFTSEDGAEVGKIIGEQIAKMVGWLEAQAEKLS